jgi:nucleotidyltransferase/DNA polymerase involved in DNA repair
MVIAQRPSPRQSQLLTLSVRVHTSARFFDSHPLSSLPIPFQTPTSIVISTLTHTTNPYFSGKKISAVFELGLQN